MFRMFSITGLPFFALAAVAILSTGCNQSSGPGRFQLAGEVTLNGQPVPAGTIVFTPDTTQGNSGPQGVAVIKDGKYDTSAAEGRGIGSGPMVIRITGQGADQSLLCEYEYRADLPKDSPTLKIEVPATAVNQRPAAAI